MSCQQTLVETFYDTEIIGPYAYGGPVINGLFKSQVKDFIVVEQLSYTLSGEGEHVYCYIEKTSVNTEYVAGALARFAKVPRKQVNYAGLKDKHGQTFQWFSIHLPGKLTPDFTSIDDPTFTVLKQARHLKKLQRGSLKGNQFTIRIRDVSGDVNLIDERIDLIKKGFPNYFGMQRFGYQAQNLAKAQALFFDGYKVKNKPLKGLLFSAVRSWFFNMQLANRVKTNSWRYIHQGELVNLSGTNSVFICDEPSDELMSRVNANEIGPAGILWGKCDNPKFQGCYERIRQALISFQPWLDALEERSLMMMTRPFICFPQDLVYEIDDNDLVLSFFLNKGSYATMLLRELLNSH